MKKNILTFAALVAMTPADLFKQAKENVVKVYKALEAATDKMTSSVHDAAIIVAAMKRRCQEQIMAKAIPADTSFAKYFKQNAGGELPGRVEALATLFNALVLTTDAKGNPLLSEENFREAKVDWLEKANAIIKAAQTKHGENWKGCDEVLDTINALSKPGDAGKKLKEIRKRQKGDRSSDEGETAAVTMTPALAAQYLCAALLKAKELSEEGQFGLCQLVYQVNDAWENCGLDEKTLKKFDKQMTDAKENGVAPHVEVVKSEQAVAA